jgi:soluble lytic murein transglycosylase
VRELTPLASLPATALAAGYWLGRAQEQAGNAAAARAAWQGVLARDSTSYYAARAAARLRTVNLHPVAESGGYPDVASVDSAITRIRLLRDLSMAPEAQLEIDRLTRDAPASRDQLLATAAAFAGTDQAARAIALGRRALTAYGASAPVYRLIYPVAVRDTIVMEARRAGIDPALVAALIRQESNFNPGATSVAGARGLMQVMPEVGRSIAPSAGITSWNPAMLYDPGINVELGVRHLAPLIRRQPNIERVLAAYNAGESRVTRWAKRAGADDPEMFTERIPFPETQDYVKSVLRNREFYRALYAW